MLAEGVLCQAAQTGRACYRALLNPVMCIKSSIETHYYALQAAATAETRRKEGDSEASPSDVSDEPVTEEEALDLQELFKKAITSSAV